ncbi:MAG: hypothetical protein IJ217_00425 [Clostridia bacterium]|nr:hypothetical protein [Clostridia bacterium]
MAIIYRYVLKERADELLKFGIRLSKQFDKEVNLNGYPKPCITGFLNPKDSEYKFQSDEYVGLKIDVPNEYCKVMDTSEIEETPNIIELDAYQLGAFKNPEVLITTSILPEKISLLDKDIDVPVLYDNSRDLYYSCRITEMLDELSPKEAYVVLKNYFDNM